MHLRGIGIDLISVARMESFLKDHGSRRAARLLTPSELKYWRQHQLSIKPFARFFAAKEAFFKALGGSWLGLEGFSEICVKCLPHGEFQVKSWPSKPSVGVTASGCFFNENGYVGAQVFIWHEKVA